MTAAQKVLFCTRQYSQTVQLTAPPAHETLKSTTRKQTGPANPTWENKAAFSTFLRTNLHPGPQLLQDIKVTENQGRKKMCKSSSHLQADTLQ